MVAGMRSTKQALLGDTVTHWPPRAQAVLAAEVAAAAASAAAPHAADSSAPPSSTSLGSAAALPAALPGFVRLKPMLFATLYPLDSGDFDTLRQVSA